MDVFTKLLKALRPWFFLYAILGVVLTYVAYTRIPFVSPLIGFGGAILPWFAAMFLVVAFQRATEVWRIARSGNVPAAVEGETIALAGTMQSESSLLESPVTRTPCVMYRYEVRQYERHGSTVPALGFAMSAPVIDASDGRFGIYALPELAFPAEKFFDAESIGNMRDYLAAHPDDGERAPVQTAGHTLHYDQQYGIPTRSLTVVERVIAPDDPVIAIGPFSATKGGFVPDPNAILESLRILKGTPSQVSFRLLRRVAASLAASAVIIAITGTVLLWFFAFASLNEAQQMHPSRNPTLLESRLELWLDRDVRPWLDGKNTNTGSIPTNFDQGVAVGRVRTDGDEHVATSARVEQQSDGTTRAIITDGTRPLLTLTVDARKHVSSLNVLGRAISAGEFEAHGYFDPVTWGARDPDSWISYFDDRTALRVGFHAAPRS